MPDNPKEPESIRRVRDVIASRLSTALTHGDVRDLLEAYDRLRDNLDEANQHQQFWHNEIEKANQQRDQALAISVTATQDRANLLRVACEAELHLSYAFPLHRGQVIRELREVIQQVRERMDAHE